MKRDPSIHVKRSSLSDILDDLGFDGETLADRILHKSGPHALRNRVIVQTTAKAKKKMERVASVDKGLAERFHLVYQQVNQANNVKTSTIKQTDGKYATLKEVAQQAKEFCEMFGMEENFGFQTYVTIGIREAKQNYSIYRLKGLADRIIKYYQDMVKIDSDGDSTGTTAFYSVWKQMSLQYLGEMTQITEPHLFVHFIHGREAADKEKAKYEDWIAAQFERWPNSMPELTQFYGDNAALAYTKYIGLKNKAHDTKEEKEYFDNTKKVQVKTSKRREVQGKKKV